MPKLFSEKPKPQIKTSTKPKSQQVVLELLSEDDCPLLSGKFFLGGVVLGDIHVVRSQISILIPLLKDAGVKIETLTSSITKKGK